MNKRRKFVLNSSRWEIVIKTSYEWTRKYATVRQPKRDGFKISLDCAFSLMLLNCTHTFVFNLRFLIAVIYRLGVHTTRIFDQFFFRMWIRNVVFHDKLSFAVIWILGFFWRCAGFTFCALSDLISRNVGRVRVYNVRIKVGERHIIMREQNVLYEKMSKRKRRQTRIKPTINLKEIVSN